MKFFLLALLVIPFAANAAEPVNKLGSKGLFYEKAINDDYQIGPTWGKVPLSQSQMQNTVYARATGATAKMGGGTGFYLGKFGGVHVLATNHHVCPAAFNCVGRMAEFTVLNKSFRANSFLGTWKNIDLTLLTITVPNVQDEALLANVAGNFAFELPLYVGQPIITAGYGIANNQARSLMVNQDLECEVYSADIRYMKDPDDFNPGPDMVWSFANGCDVSHGDSGSAMVDRNNGKVLGLIWTGRIPKDPIVRDASYLARIQQDQSEDIWKQLSYAVPAAKIQEFLTKTYEEENSDFSRKQIFKDILGI
jgi:hypothetical protein